MKSVAFIANYQKTIFFHYVAVELARQNVKIYWIAVSKIWTDWLISKGVDKGRILYLPRSTARNGASPLGDFGLNELIYSDRTFRTEAGFGQKYLESIQKPVCDFISRNNISFVFGEATWAHEILINRMCTTFKELRCQYLKPHTIRIPNGRFAFFKDEHESSLYEISNQNRDGEVWDFELKKPDYYYLNNKEVSLIPKLMEYLKKIGLTFSEEKNDLEDPTQRLDKISFIGSKILEEINFFTYKFFVKKLKLNDFPDKYWVYYLHKQPEASVDVVGRYYEDQFKNIYWLARKMPDDSCLMVKEHTNALGDRPLSFFRKLHSINRVSIIDESIDSYTLIDKAAKTCTVSGTVAYEAALLGKEAIIFSNPFFSSLPTIQVRNGNEVVNKSTIEEFKVNVFVSSFEGIVSDPSSDPRCIEKENVENVSSAFLKVINDE